MTYEEFAEKLDQRPKDVSPLSFVATMRPRPPEVTQWLIRWVKAQR